MMETAPQRLPYDHDSTSSDGYLIECLRGGNDSAASRLFRRYGHRLRAFARLKVSAGLRQRLDADDIVQSVFLRFFTAARAGQYQVPAGEDLWDLLLVITLNKIRDEEAFHRAAKRDYRRTASKSQTSDDFSWAVIARQRGVADSLLRLSVREALERLPAESRSIVELRMEGQEVTAIAQLTAQSVRTVERTLREARNTLAEFFA
jgi:RNA polymerase sigma factor (sigma-70 family)